jgi:DNA-binding CsgD family transcriptional regulator
VAACPLSARQLQILALIAIGESDKRISAYLRIGERAIRWNLHEAFVRLGCANRANAVAVALTRRWISCEVNSALGSELVCRAPLSDAVTARRTFLPDGLEPNHSRRSDDCVGLQSRRDDLECEASTSTSIPKDSSIIQRP